MNLRIPLAKPEITDEDREAVLSVLRTPHLSMGPKLAEFEQAICDYLQSPCAVAVNSGTSALHLALRILKLPPGSEVILPSFTFGALLNVLLQEQLQPVFVDIDPETLNTTPAMVEPAITERTKVIIAVHTFGRPVAADQLREIAHRRGLFLIEDACEALGAEVAGRKAGTFGHVGALAFYPNKQITTGEGGMLLTSDAALASHARRLRNQGRDSSLGWFEHSEIGYSYRLSEMNCVLGLSQLNRIEAILQRRQFLAETYDRKLAGLQQIVRPSICDANGCISWFAYAIQVGPQFDCDDRDWLCQAMLKKGIATGRYFAPLHRQPVLHSTKKISLPGTELAASRIVALPFFNQLTEAEVQEVCEALADSLAELQSRKA